MYLVNAIIVQINIFRIYSSVKRLINLTVLQIFAKLLLKMDDRSQVTLDLIKVSVDHRISNLSKNSLGSICFNHSFKKIYAFILSLIE